MSRWVTFALVLAAGLTGVMRPGALTPDPTKQPLGVELTTSTPTVKFGEYPKFNVTLVNRDNREMTLVKPGDGSDCGWRTPVISWVILGGHAPKGVFGRCGNINGLKPEEVVTLRAGEKFELGEWIGTPHFPGPGKYKVRFRYMNIPDLQWKGLGKHDPDAMTRVRGSMRVTAESNEIEIEVLDPN